MPDIVSLLNGSDWVKRTSFNDKLVEINQNAAGRLHNHDDWYYTEEEVAALIKTATAPLEAEIISLKENITSKATSSTLFATIGTAWSGSGPYTQTVAVVGILESDNPIADIVLSGITQTDTGRLEAWGMVSRMVTKADGITVTCLEDKPTVEMPIQIKVVR